MREYNIDPYKVQSYFKGVCKNFYMLFEEIKRLENELKKIKAICPDEELEALERHVQSYSREMLQKKEEIQLRLQEHERKCEQHSEVLYFWCRKLSKEREILRELIYHVKENNFTIIINSKEEVIALMDFYREHSVSYYDVINTDESYLVSFPTDDMSKAFLEAYRTDIANAMKGVDVKNDEKMKKVCQKYF